MSGFVCARGNFPCAGVSYGVENFGALRLGVGQHSGCMPTIWPVKFVGDFFEVLRRRRQM